jgi:indolepyruvate ferredoxin oxidoreductase
VANPSICIDVNPANIGLAIAIAKLPMDVRGFGPVKDKGRGEVATRRAALWAKWPGLAAGAAA